MKIEYDKEVDAAYIYLDGSIKDGEVTQTIPVKENIILDYNKKGKLLGIEILNASKVIDLKVLEKATSIKP